MKTNGTPLSKIIAEAPAVLYLVLELSNKRWLLHFSDGSRRRQRCLEAGNVVALNEEIAKAKEKFALALDAVVVSCFEAGRDGFWLDRYLHSLGMHNLVVDASSIKVDRRGKHAKTDRLDVEALYEQLYDYCRGKEKALRVVHVPNEQDEDELQLHRELAVLKHERVAHRNRIRSVLVRHGLRPACIGGAGWGARVEGFRQWDDTPLGADTQRELLREGERLALVERQIRDLERERGQRIAAAPGKKLDQVRRLMLLRSIGPAAAWVLVMEMFGWRGLKNRREVGALAGLTGSPYESGDLEHEQGISKAGNARVRSLAVELAWFWLRYQPESALSRWFATRFSGGGRRARKVGIVAVARKLLIALWRYLEYGEIPAGARLKTV
ncbi:MAG: IS110 family transposase [Sulfitobacter sp.]|nr:IS110 family transposase [Sulfitobacter sp.]